jgi:D-alanyl-D-alanine endopeptidase (penicillin-binding protein 7)
MTEMRRLVSRLLLAAVFALGAIAAPPLSAPATAAPRAGKSEKPAKKPGKKPAKKAEKKPGKKPPKKAEKRAEAKPDKKAGKAAEVKAKVARAKKKARAGGAVAELNEDGKPNIQSSYGIAVDLDTNEVLWGRKPDTVQQIASISKLLAAVVVVEKGIELDGKQTISEVDERVARGGAKSRLLRGYTVTNRDLLHAAMLGSDNRAVSAMGRSVGLDARAFAAAMTEKARELGLTRTRFGDPTGLDERNVSTPREIVGMLQAALKNETLAPILSTAEYTAKYVVGKAPKQRAGLIEYRSTNRLIKGSPYKIYGGKTGYTDEAKYCFVVAGELDHGRRIALTVLHGQGELTRFADFRRMAAYLKRNPPTLIAAPATEAETTEPPVPVPFKLPEPDAGASPMATAEAPVRAPGPATGPAHDPEDLPKAAATP